MLHLIFMTLHPFNLQNYIHAHIVVKSKNSHMHDQDIHWPLSKPSQRLWPCPCCHRGFLVDSGRWVQNSALFLGLGNGYIKPQDKVTGPQNLKFSPHYRCDISILLPRSLLFPSTPTTPAFTLYPEYVHPTPPSGPLQLLSPLLWALSHQIFA